MMSKNILITGGTGFIGSSLINSIKNIHNVINIGRRKNYVCSNIPWNLTDGLDSLIPNNIDIIVHCASIVGNQTSSISKYIDINVKSTLKLLEFCKKNNVKKFILLSTGGVYGFSKKASSEQDICNPKDMYSLSKYFAEKVCELYKDKLSIVILRLFFPYGSGQKGRLISNLFDNILNHRKIKLNKNGQPIINPIHIFDVIGILKIIIDDDNIGGIFNVCGNEFYSIKDICKRIALISNIDDLEFSYEENHIDNLIGTNEKICKTLNYTIDINLSEGLKLFLMSLKKGND